MNNRTFEYYWNEKKQRFILMVDRIELDEYKTEKGLKLYDKSATYIKIKPLEE